MLSPMEFVARVEFLDPEEHVTRVLELLDRYMGKMGFTRDEEDEGLYSLIDREKKEGYSVKVEVDWDAESYGTPAKIIVRPQGIDHENNMLYHGRLKKTVEILHDVVDLLINLSTWVSDCNEAPKNPLCKHALKKLMKVENRG